MRVEDDDPGLDPITESLFIAERLPKFWRVHWRGVIVMRIVRLTQETTAAHNLGVYMRMGWANKGGHGGDGA